MNKIKLKSLTGFTLIELMIGCSIMIVAFVGILSLYRGCEVINEMARNLTVAVNDARIVIERVRTQAATSLTNTTTVNWTTWAANNGCASLDNEQVMVTYNNPAADPLEVNVTVNWQERAGRNRAVSLNTILTEKE